MEEMQMEDKGKTSWKESAKVKALACYKCVREKCPVYWRIVRTKTVELWNSGPKGKTICISAAVLVLLLGGFMFSGKSKKEKNAEAIAKSREDAARIIAGIQTNSDIGKRVNAIEAEQDDSERAQQIAEQKAREEAQRRDEEERIRQQVENDRLQAEEQKRRETEQSQKIAEAHEDEEESDLDNVAKNEMSSVEIWGEYFQYAPEKKVPYSEFAKVYYTIEDAFLPQFVEPLLKLHSGQLIFFAGYAQLFAQNLIPRVDHLLFYCCRTGLASGASAQEKKNYTRLIAMAQMEKRMIRTYAFAFGQDNKELYNDAEKQFKEFVAIRKTLPAHNPAADAEEKYAALPYPSRPISLNDAAGDIFGDCLSYFTCLYNFWPGEEEESQEEKNVRAKRRMAFAQRKWVPIDVGSFPIKTFCGLEFGQTLAACEKTLGNAIGPLYYLYDNHSYNSAVYHLRKPFRKFTRAFLKFGTEREEYEKTPGGRTVEGLRSVRLEADIPADVNYESCLEELAKVKKLLEEKYKLDLGKGQVGEKHIGRSYWYGVGLSENGRIVLGILPTRKKYNLPQSGNISYEDAEKADVGVTDGSMTMVLEIQYADRDKMEKLADNTRKALDAKRTAEAEAKKKRLNVSENEGADVL